VAAMKVDDEVATNEGLLGKVTDLDDNLVTLDVAMGVNFQVQRHAIAQMVPKGTFKELDAVGENNRKTLANDLKALERNLRHPLTIFQVRLSTHNPIMRPRTPR